MMTASENDCDDSGSGRLAALRESGLDPGHATGSPHVIAPIAASSQISESATSGRFWRNVVCQAGNVTQDLSLHASGFSLYVRGVAFGQRLRLLRGCVCLLIDGPFERTGSVDWLGEVASVQRSLACSPPSGSTICHLTRIRTIPGGYSRD